MVPTERHSFQKRKWNNCVATAIKYDLYNNISKVRLTVASLRMKLIQNYSIFLSFHPLLCNELEIDELGSR